MENKEQDKSTKQQNLSLILLSLFIAALIISTFILSPQKYIINTSIIILTAFLIVIVLSRSFDSFSVGKILEISKNAEENKARADRLENELLKFLNINFQSQKASNNVIIENSASRNLAVQQATDDEIEQNKTEEKNEENSKPVRKIHRVDSEKLKILVLRKYFGISAAEKYCRMLRLSLNLKGLILYATKP